MRKQRPAQRSGEAAPGRSPERIQKALAAAGIGSRRDVERWIAAGRLLINGIVPEPGARLADRDQVTLDGQPVRLRRPSLCAPGQLIMVNRSPGSPLDRSEAARRASGGARLRQRPQRWLVINPLPPVDGGLELLTDDGSLAQRISRAVRVLTMDFVLRARGEPGADLLREMREGAEVEGEALDVLAAEAQPGEGQNHWLSLTARATRPAQIRHWLAARGVIVSRLMRIRFGPLHLGRDLPRGHARVLSRAERNALLNEVDAASARHAPQASSGRASSGSGG